MNISNTLQPQISGAPALPAIGIAKYMIVGALIVAVFFVGFIGWASFAPLHSAAATVGIVKVFSNRKLIQHLEGGIVAEIKVRDGDRVEKGDVLVVLDGTQAQAASSLQGARYDDLLAREARLIAQRDGLNEIDFSSELMARADIPDVDAILKMQRATFQGHIATVQGQSGILAQQIVQVREEINGLEQQAVAQATELKIVNDDKATMAKLLAEGYAQRPRLRELERDSARLSGSLGQLKSKAASLKQRISETNLRMEALERNAQQQTLQELQQVQSELADVTERRRSAVDIMKRTTIVAPIAGTVVSSLTHTTGGIVAPGATLMEIVPADDKLVIEARLNPLDIDVVHVGQAASINFLALSQRNVLPIAGEVTQLSADALIDEQQGISYYLAQIEIESGYKDKLSGQVLHPGMQAEVMIETGKRTAMDYFLKPVRDSFRRALIED